MFFHFNKQNTQRTCQRGFSLVELMVTISIVLLVTGVVMVRYSSFNNIVILKSQTYELALDIREAQVYGVSVGGNTGTFRDAYGIYLNLNSPNTYRLFRDNSSLGHTALRYDADGDPLVDETVGDVYIIDPRFVVSQICTTASGTGTRTCTTQEVSVAFKRPDFDANIWTDDVASIDQVEIVISSIGDVTQQYKVVLYPSGQISVQ